MDDKILKNQEYEIIIEDNTTSGEGVGRINGYALFVKDTVAKDLVRVRVTKTGKTYGYGRLLEILKPSPDRVDAPCPIARACGGCSIMAMDYQKQLEFKQKLIQNNLQRIGGITDISVPPVLGMEHPFRYRNKAQFPIGVNKEGEIISGFYAGRTHSIVACEDCLIGHEINGPILATVKQHMTHNGILPYDENTHSGLVRHVLIRTGFTTKEVMVCLVLNGKSIAKSQALVDALRALELPDQQRIESIMINVNREKTNVILGQESVLLWGRAYIEDFIGAIKYQISPLSFYQVNPLQTKVLYDLALEYANLTGSETVWDLYCGIGTISLFLAQKAKKVYGVEIVPQAIDDARNNAKINGIQNVEFYVGKAEDVLPEKYQQEKIYAQVIVVDPPRKGCDESLLATMVQMQPERIVYVSCDSATLARDLKYLLANGYKLEKIQGVDQFCHSTHVESVVLLSRQKADGIEGN